MYLLLTVVCGVGLYLFGLTPFQAVNYSLTAVSTGGFGTESDSVGAIFTVGSKIWLIIFMIIGAVSFPFYLTLMGRRFSDLGKKFEEVWWFLAMMGFFCGLMLLQKLGGGTDVTVIDLVFNIVSIATSTGYVSDDYDHWSWMGVGIMLFLMMIGGCSGSTSGGLKVSRVILWFRFTISGLQRAFRPQAVAPVKLNGRQVPEETLGQLFLVLTLFGFFGIVGTMVFQMFDPGHSLLGSVSGVLSCLGNIGPAFEEMGPTESIHEISSASKFLFVGLMILGRLEYVALLVLFIPSLWRRY
jgi:trk system potassium uptake protein TrkH